jgi:hypothetical protein
MAFLSVGCPGRAGRWVLPLILLLPLLSSCQEHLPTYVRPEVELIARVTTEALVDFAGLEGAPPLVRVDVTNQTDQETIGQIVLEVPYQIRVDVTLYLARDPSRKLDMHGTTTFTQPEHRLVPGKTVRVDLDQVPPTDDQGRPWNWGQQGPPQDLEVTIQGTARVPGYDLTIPVPSYRIRVRY